MSERHGYLVEFPGTKRKRVFYGAGRADVRAFNYGQATGERLGVTEFYQTNLVSAKTITFVVGQTWHDLWKLRNSPARGE
jgi:hypothetical protein